MLCDSSINLAFRKTVRREILVMKPLASDDEHKHRLTEHEHGVANPKNETI
jgi:hypothetical protein